VLPILAAPLGKHSTRIGFVVGGPEEIAVTAADVAPFYERDSA